VRALIGSFANRNLTHFHRLDGSGYSFLTEQVLRLDYYNPTIAARMVEPLAQWKKMDEKRQVLMRNELEKLKAAKPSKNLDEIVSKALK
jgi:aminopeptidase N